MTAQDQLREAAEDLALAQRQLQAIGVLLSAASFAIADSLAAQGREAKAKRPARKPRHRRKG